MADTSELQRILDETECLFTWEVRGTYKRDKLITKFRSILNNERYVPSQVQSWYIRACLAHQLFLDRNVEAFEEINQAVEDLEETSDRLTRKCMKSCHHILYATKAFMVSKCHQDGGWWGLENLPTLQEAVEIIPPKGSMTQTEKAGLNGFKANILSAHNKTCESAQGIRLLTNSMRLDPTEYEWRKSLMEHVIRNNLFIKGKKARKKSEDNTIPGTLVKWPLKLIDGLLKDSKLPPDRKISVMYFKAVAEEHYVRNREKTPEIVATIETINSLWREILGSKPMNPSYVKYGARWFLENLTGEPACNEQDRNLVLEAVLRVMENYPKDKKCLAAARFVQNLPENVLASSETAQRIISRLQSL